MINKFVVLDDMDKKLLNLIQLDFPLTKQPFKELGEELGTPEKEIMMRIERLITGGAIRRIGPIINTRNTGGVSTLAAVKAEKDRINEAANIISEYDEVSHNYLRDGKYNIWFTVSAANKTELNRILVEIKVRTGCPLIELPTKRLFKIGVKFEIR
ncbi:MAG: hypothetical protein DNFNHJIP_00391 [Candidatus Argoarchaeum ethanivorans]|uniref:siroheme decarboxylase n=1 Tax=Candidatus Argoarchaeum ethanivorans TaxID=2608793 RepID=A0A812A024_9EURY|nr:MAG: hypothetical protein DNFNHJIP_00391 [Candidatus Argoarchaeum ethanivorans]